MLSVTTCGSLKESDPKSFNFQNYRNFSIFLLGFLVSMAALKPTGMTEVNEDPVSLNPESTQSLDADEDKQDGVRVAEAITSSWSRKSLIVAYAW
jgi:hypothetical protein